MRKKLQIYSIISKETLENIKNTIEVIPEKDPPGKMTEFVAGRILYFELRLVSLEETLAALKNLKPKRSSGSSSVPKIVVKGAAEVLAVPLQRIINASIREKKFPSAFKNIIGIPVFKKGSRQDKSCYRMVQNSESCSTAFELLINKELVLYLPTNYLISYN